MPITQAVLSPAGPYTGSLPTLTAYVDLAGGPDPSYAGHTVVLCLDQRTNANPESAQLVGPISAVMDGTGVATFTGLSTAGGFSGGTNAYLVAAVLPNYTWTNYYKDQFTEADGTVLAARDNGATTGAITGHVPAPSPQYFEWTDGAWYARIFSNRVELFDDHGVLQDQWFGYAWDSVTPANNVKRDCRCTIEVTPVLGPSSTADNYGRVALMPNSFAFTDYEGYYTITNNLSLMLGTEWEHHINFLQYGANKYASRELTPPTNNTMFTFSVWSVEDYMFVLVNGTFELGMAIDALAVTSAAPYVDHLSDVDVNLRFDNFTMDVPTEVPGGGGGPEPQDAQTLVMSVDTGRTQNLRIEALLGRGGAEHLNVGNNLIYRSQGLHSGDTCWEFGCLHSSDTLVNLRYRYSSGGAGDWTTLSSGYTWSIATSRKLIVELDGDVHTFRIADAYGHDERILGRIQDARFGGKRAGWKVRGTVAQDILDNFRVMDFASLVRIKYRLSPDDDRLQIPLWTGTVQSGNPSLITDPTKLWSINELVGAFLRIVEGPGVGSDSKIVANSETSVTPETDFLATPTNASKYLVYDKYYTGTERLQFWRDRGLKEPKYLFYHGERRGAPVEPEQRMLIDANHVAELSLSVSQVQYGVDEGVLRVIIEPDDDVATWELYMRKDAWPTLQIGTANPDQFGEPDTTYRRYQGSTDLKEQDIEVANGIWYILAVPYDTNGYRGPVASVFIEAVGTDPGDGTGGGGGGDPGGGTGTGGDDPGGGIKPWVLSNCYAFHPSSEAGSSVVVMWNYPDSPSFPVGDATVDIKVFDTQHKQYAYFIVTDWPVDSKQYTHVTIPALSGNFRFGDFQAGTKNVDPWTTVVFTITLNISGVAVSSASCSYSNYGRILY